MDEETCQYASKPCTEPRATKDDGSLHRLCESHRDKANAAQRRWHARHRERIEAMYAAKESQLGGRRRRRRRLVAAVAAAAESDSDASPLTHVVLDGVHGSALTEEDVFMLRELVLDVSFVKMHSEPVAARPHEYWAPDPRVLSAAPPQ